ncbi:crotonase/enoyl-CoA hydratase family protein [Mycolicibacterium monacense]|uniref:Enoyl-CoA hydratase n=3 Tax=Mycobacteriaceae TaxID=1762 RepID=A0AAD1J3C1_MYCMB|nr:crotonase/enoyl-CoA hydratase family protein [Mycolicibacterium monacense]MDA4103948.1 enoyl-CoA hydratase [Mycolicibacterium monacense DSM 44395]OBF46851.1 enoyl-CoA hydratase [Mycolicibacterium monacense]ORB23188.1 enoyl-CoA hydratase [Mycolicibacterium monacense DSM 44395]QHP85260.1 enoyl-CoA hydratase [Mycolicibacterium monacense DSM 44395]BBZ61887.1 enoyl-CoA hydratase [Mycolicibacterium monacense]
MSAQQPAQPTYEEVDYRFDDGVAIIALNAPQRRNALRNQMLRDLWEALDTADRDPHVRAVVLTGAGKHFCVGAELTGPDTLIEALEEDRAGHTPTGYREPGGRVSERLFDMRTPVVAAVNGDAVGGGASIMAATDVRISGEASRFGFVFTRRGVVPESASSWFLPRLVGLTRATDWVLSGRVFDAAEAYDAGLLTKVVAPDAVLDEALAYARVFVTETSPTSVALARRLLGRSWGHPTPRSAAEDESRVYAGRLRSADVHEGVMSFLERRPAVFPPLDDHPADHF